MIDTDSIANSVLIALADEHSDNIDKGAVDVFLAKTDESDPSPVVHVKVWATEDPDETPRRFTVTVKEQRVARYRGSLDEHRGAVVIRAEEIPWARHAVSGGRMCTAILADGAMLTCRLTSIENVEEVLA